MATDTTSPVQDPSPLEKETGAGLTAALAWGGLMSFLGMLWLQRKYALSFFYPALLFLVGAGFIGLALWYGITLWRKTPDKEASLVRQKGIVRAFLSGVGLLFLISGGYFLFTYGLKAVGEGIGFLFLGSAALALGLLALRGGPKSQDLRTALFHHLQTRAEFVGTVLLGLSALLAVGYWSLFLSGIAGRAIFPELLGLSLLILTLVGVGMYLRTAPGELSPAAARTVLLALGGLVGLSLFVTAIARTLAWRETTLFGGLAAWQGEHSWRIWVCAYLGMVSLALMSASLLLARGDIRASAALRRLFFGYNTFVTALLLLLVLAVLNVVVYALFPFQFDWTSERGIYSLAKSSQNLLARLDKPVTVYVTLPRNVVAQELTTFLENCKTHNPEKFNYKQFSPDSDQAEMKELGDRFPSIFQSVPKFGTVPRRGGLLVVYGEMPSDKKKTVPHVFIAHDELFSAKRKKEAEPITREFKGEIELMKAIGSFVAEKKSRVYILQGNGELSLEKKEPVWRDRVSLPLFAAGASQLQFYLTEEKFDASALSFAPSPAKPEPGIVFAKEDPLTKKKEVPPDAGFLIIAGSSQPLQPEALSALDRYLEKGGKLLVCLDVVVDREYSRMINTGVEDLLRKFGIEVTNQFVLGRFSPHVLASPPSRTENELALMFQEEKLVMENPRVLKLGPPGKYEVETLLETGPQILLETDLKLLLNPARFIQNLEAAKELEARLSHTRVPVAMVATPLGDKKKRPQIFVFGDAEFISDGFFRTTHPSIGLKNLAMVSSCLEFSSERPGLVGPKSRQVTNYMVKPDTNFGTMALVPGWVMVLTLMGLGAGLWVVRRR